MGTASWGAFPQGTNLQIVQSSTPGISGPNDPNERLLWLADRACDILLLGQNLSSEINGQGSRAAAEVHREVELDLYETYAEFLVAILNEQLIPALIRQNWGNLDEVPFVEVEIPRPQRDEEMARRDKLLFQDMGLPVSLQYLYERHRVQSPDPGGALFQCVKMPRDRKTTRQLRQPPTPRNAIASIHCTPDRKAQPNLPPASKPPLMRSLRSSPKPKPPATIWCGTPPLTIAPLSFAASATATAGATSGSSHRPPTTIAAAP